MKQRDKNVLIVTQSFPPLNNIAARRYGWMSEYFSDNGWTPYVLTRKSEGPLAVKIPEDHCFRIGTHYQQTAKRNEEYQKWMWDVNPMVNVLRKITNVRLNSLDASLMGWYSDVRKEFDSLVNNLPEIDLIIGSYGPSAALIISRKLSKELQVPWIADYRDMAALRDYEKSRGVKWIDVQIERHILKSSSGIITISKLWSEIFSQCYQKPAETVYNGFYTGHDIDTKFPERSELTPYLHFAGTLYPQRMMASELLFKALSNSTLDNLNIVYRSLGPESLDKYTLRLAQKYKIEDRLKLLPPADPDIIKQEQYHAVANLVFSELSDNKKWGAGILTGKFLQLLPGTTPILSVCRSDNEMTEILHETGRGMSCSTSDQIKNFLHLAVNDRKKFQGSEMSIEAYSARTQAEKLCNFFCSVI